MSQQYIEEKTLFFSWLKFPSTKKILDIEPNISFIIKDIFWEIDIPNIKNEYRKMYRKSDLIGDVCLILDLLLRYIYEIHPELYDCFQITYLGKCLLRITNLNVNTGQCISIDLSCYRRDLILYKPEQTFPDKYYWISSILIASISSIVTVLVMNRFGCKNE